MHIENLNIELVRYLITKCEIQTPALYKNYVVPNSAIGDIQIENDYENYNFPYFLIDMELPSSIVRAIRKNPLQTYLLLSLQANYFNDLDGDGKMEPTSRSTFLNDKYIMVIEDKSRSLMDSDLEEAEDQSGFTYESANPESNNVYTFSLYKEKDITNTQKNINAILSSANAIDALMYVLTQSGMENVLLSPPISPIPYTNHTQMVLPPYSALRHIERIAEEYSIHPNGTLIYFGLDKTYIIDKGCRCTVFSTNEFKTTYILYMSKFTKVFSAGCCRNSKSKTNYIMLQPEDAVFDDLSKNIEWSFGKGVNIIKNDTKTISMGDASTGKFYFGDVNHTGVQRAMKSLSKIAKLGFRNCDVSMLTPNKEIVISIDDQKYNSCCSSYRVAKTTINFIKEGGGYFTPAVDCLLYN